MVSAYWTIPLGVVGGFWVGQSALQELAPLEKESAKIETSVASCGSGTARKRGRSFAAEDHWPSKLSVEALRPEGRCGCNERDEPASSGGDVWALAGSFLEVEDLGRSWKF
jgi:hypothetical protein